MRLNSVPYTVELYYTYVMTFNCVLPQCPVARVSPIGMVQWMQLVLRGCNWRFGSKVCVNLKKMLKI